MASTVDGFYIVQGMWHDGRVALEEYYDDEGEALREAKKLHAYPAFSGDTVRVITRDGELVWRSKKEKLSRKTSAEKHERGENPRVSAPLKKRIDCVLGRGRRG